MKAVYDQYPTETRNRLLNIRDIVLDAAKSDVRIGALEETLKWGQISYLPRKSGIGTTVRLGQSKTHPNTVSVFVHCGTSLIDDWRQHYGGSLTFVGNRELVLPLDKPFPEETLRHCIAMALTYHLSN